MSELMGYAWLAHQYDLTLAQPLTVVSGLGNPQKSGGTGDVSYQYYTAKYLPDPTLRAHLTFALKREPLHLELMARLFSKLDPAELLAWITSEPTGQYARKACFFYEWMTDRSLDHPGLTQSNYVNALDPDEYLVASQPIPNARWRIRDNLPGVPDFCPTVRLTPKLKQALAYDPALEIDRLGAEFGEDMLMRSSVWLSLKESRSSFAIEHELKKVDRIQRFAAVMERRCGKGSVHLSAPDIEILQREILGDSALSYGLRQSPVFVGETTGYGDYVHYLAPHWHQVPHMLSGLKQFELRTQGQSALVRAAAISFGFVYIHPMSDGNGRVSRFLINDVLRHDKAIPAPYILPVSSVLQKHSLRPRNYDQVLESFSRPLMDSLSGQYRFGSKQKAPDGTEYNLHFDGYEETAPAWRYIDMTVHAEYMADVVQITINEEMRAEADILRSHYRARQAIKEVLEGPDRDIDAIIRSVRQNQGKLSGKLAKQYPQLAEPEVFQDVVLAIETHLPWSSSSG